MTRVGFEFYQTILNPARIKTKLKVKIKKDKDFWIVAKAVEGGGKKPYVFAYYDADGRSEFGELKPKKNAFTGQFTWEKETYELPSVKGEVRW